MTKFREKDRVRVEFEGEVIGTEAHHPDDRHSAHLVTPLGMWVRLEDSRTAFVYPRNATLLERQETTYERVARLERENAEMKARLAALGQPPAIPFPETPQTVSSSPEIVAEQARSTSRIEKIVTWENARRLPHPVKTDWRAVQRAVDRDIASASAKGPTILIDKITRWFTKR